MTTSFPCRSVLVMLIVMGLFGTRARTAGLAAGLAVGVPHGFAADAAIDDVWAGAAIGVGFHSRIDLAGGGWPTGSAAASVSGVTAGAAAGAAIGVGFHSRIDLAGGALPTGSPAASDSNVVATSTSITTRTSIPVLNIAKSSMRSL